MKKLFFALAFFVLFAGCVSQEQPREQALLEPSGDDGKRDNTLGEQDFYGDFGTGLIDSEQSFEDFDEIEYLETLQDINVSAIITDCSKHQTQGAMDYCYKDKAVIESKESHCESISSVSIKRQCYRAAAIAKLDTNVCRKLDTENGVFACITAIASDEETLDEKLCEQIPASSEWKQKCIEQVKREQETALS